MTETEQEEVETLCENWEALAPLVAEVQRRTGLTRTQAMLLWVGSLPDDEPDGPWKSRP